MDINSVIQIINGVGFPIAVSIALFYQNTKQDERYQSLMKDLTEVINNNTSTLSELSTKIEGGVKSNG